MAAKQISYDASAREHIRSGVRQLARAVKVTLGPRGRAVLLEKKWGAPIVSVDGVTGARGLNLSHWPGNTTPRELRHDLEARGHSFSSRQYPP